jgi:FkbM family methyltransferase
MHYNFIEIGTANFDSLIEKSSDTVNGLSIEPLKHLLNQLPNKLNVEKLNIAISNKQGTIDIYYVTQETIDQYDLPWWVIGSSSVGHPHEFVIKVLNERNLPISDIVKKDTVNTTRLSTIMDEYRIKSLDMLKVDTEGHDIVILEDYLQECEINKYPLPKIIQFEHNGLYPEEDYIKVKNRAVKLGYSISEYAADTVMHRTHT